MEDAIWRGASTDVSYHVYHANVDDLVMSEILGYTEREGSWEPIIQPRGYIYTQAFILCRECGGSISSHGGPRYNSLCLKCYETNVKRNMHDVSSSC